MKHKNNILIIIVITILLLGDCSNGVYQPPINFTLDDLYLAGITNYINQKILLSTKIKWEYCALSIPEDPTPEEEVRKRICGPHPTVVFDNINNYVKVEKYSTPGNFFIVSDGLVIIRDGYDGEQYSFNGDILSNNDNYYVLEGSLNYREWLKVTDELLLNPKFIAQSNNPIYWSQTFELHLENILK